MKRRTFLMSAQTDGQRMELPRCRYLEFLGLCMVFISPFSCGRTRKTTKGPSHKRMHPFSALFASLPHLQPNRRDAGARRRMKSPLG